MCPACRHRLRFEPGTSTKTVASQTALHVEGTLQQPQAGAAREYSMILTIRDRRGEEITRQVVGVGALAAGDLRTFSLDVEISER